ncbi:MAG: arabinofuranosidase catalytic domain-containing protein [Prosthecobacter sp.]
METVRSGTAAAPFVGVLDDYELNVTAVRCPAKRLLTSYSGPLVRVARLEDGVESDIAALPSGWLDLDALATFLMGGTPLLRYVYDQRGSNNLVQAVALSQPTLGTAVSEWGGLPAIVFGGVPQMMSLETPTSPLSIMIGVHSTSSTGFGRFFSNATGNSTMFDLGVSGAFGRWDNADGQQNVNFADASLAHGLEMWYNGANSIIRLDTAELASAATAPLADVVNFGDYALGGGQAFIGSMAYVVEVNAFYDITQRAALRAALASVFPFAL